MKTLALSAKRQLDICRFERIMDYRFNNKSLIHRALTHKSYADEKGWSHTSCNERLELLGDAVLDLIVVEYLFEKYPNHDEGQLTKIKGTLVCGNNLSRLARNLDIISYLLVGKELENCEDNNRKQKAILADAFESVIGAIYQDGGRLAVQKFVEKNVLHNLEQILSIGKDYNYKSALQEISQREFKALPEYIILKEEGPDHCKNFKVAVAINSKVMGNGRGANKKEAEQVAAKNALDKIRHKIFWKTMKSSVSTWFQWNKKKNNKGKNNRVEPGNNGNSKQVKNNGSPQKIS